MNAQDALQMMTTILTNQNLLVKSSLIILLLLYILFSLILSVQIYRLNTIINQVRFSPIFRMLALLHSIFAIILLGAALFLL